MRPRDGLLLAPVLLVGAIRPGQMRGVETAANIRRMAVVAIGGPMPRPRGGRGWNWRRLCRGGHPRALQLSTSGARCKPGQIGKYVRRAARSSVLRRAGRPWGVHAPNTS